MDVVKSVMKDMGVLPKLRLGEKIKGAGMKSFGPKKVKFLSEPEPITKKIMGKRQKVLRFEVEHEGTRYWWFVKVLNDENQANYLLERVAEIKVGDERVLELMKQGAINYTDIREVGAPARLADEDEGEDVIHLDEDEGEGDE